MCGIYGSINFLKSNFENLKNLLKHRGPDDADEFCYKNLYMFHSRLSIQDLSKVLDTFIIKSFVLLTMEKSIIILN